MKSLRQDFSLGIFEGEGLGDQTLNEMPRKFIKKTGRRFDKRRFPAFDGGYDEIGKDEMMAAVSEQRTNVMRILLQKGIVFEAFHDDNQAHTALETAAALGVDPRSLFKTLVTQGRSGDHYVFMVPGGRSLDLKKAAKAAGEKSVEMIPQRLLLPLTGYVHGGCSPIGMKKRFPSFIHESAAEFDSICFSAGKVGCQVKLAFADLQKVLPIRQTDLCEVK